MRRTELVHENDAATINIAWLPGGRRTLRAGRSLPVAGLCPDGLNTVKIVGCVNEYYQNQAKNQTRRRAGQYRIAAMVT